MSDPYKLLVKYPSRGRPQRFFDGMKSIYDNLYDTENFHVSITLDKDDEAMIQTEVLDKIFEYKNVSIGWGLSSSKVEAVNRSMPDYDFDIVLVMSDDMRVTFYGFDQILRTEFEQHGLDTLLHIPDFDAKSALATMYIAGKPYYDRFGFIYNPEYQSLHCDNEVQDIAKMLKRYRYVNCPGVISHLNPAYGHLPKDEMFIRQQEIGWSIDQETYNRRKAKNFDL